MIILIEIIILCLIFTIFAYSLSINPIKSLYNYPPIIQERVKTLKQYKDKIPTNKNKIITKSLVALSIIIIVSLILRYINGYTTFLESFLSSLFIWTIINIYDVIIIDIIWFCHSKSVIIKGTEDMIKSYKDYLFHIKEGIKGEVIGTLICLIIGLVIHFIL